MHSMPSVLTLTTFLLREEGEREGAFLNISTSRREAYRKGRLLETGLLERGLLECLRYVQGLEYKKQRQSYYRVRANHHKYNKN